MERLFIGSAWPQEFPRTGEFHRLFLACDRLRVAYRRSSPRLHPLYIQMGLCLWVQEGAKVEIAGRDAHQYFKRSVLCFEFGCMQSAHL